jgi:hypothetical protein
MSWSATAKWSRPSCRLGVIALSSVSGPWPYRSNRFGVNYAAGRPACSAADARSEQVWLGPGVESAMHSGPWWVGMGVLALGSCAARDWRTVRQGEAQLPRASASPAALSFAGLGLIGAGLMFASNDGKLPKFLERPSTAIADRAAVLAPPVRANSSPGEQHRVEPLARPQLRSRQRAGNSRHSESVAEQRTNQFMKNPPTTLKPRRPTGSAD